MDGLVETGRDELPFIGDHRPNRDLPQVERLMRLLQGHSHENARASRWYPPLTGQGAIMPAHRVAAQRLRIPKGVPARKSSDSPQRVTHESRLAVLV